MTGVHKQKKTKDGKRVEKVINNEWLSDVGKRGCEEEQNTAGKIKIKTVSVEEQEEKPPGRAAWTIIRKGRV